MIIIIDIMLLALCVWLLSLWLSISIP